MTLSPIAGINICGTSASNDVVKINKVLRDKGRALVADLLAVVCATLWLMGWCVKPSNGGE